MDVVVENLTKSFGYQKAVDSVSFEVKKGEILGFLGPNGAGKTTTLKIMSCFLFPDYGNIRIGKYSIHKNPYKIKQIIGYLPEHNPLYEEMNVIDFLDFIARVHNIPKYKIIPKVMDMIRMCGLDNEKHKTIRELSKGYRQRVGLAQALIHDPGGIAARRTDHRTRSESDRRNQGTDQKYRQGKNGDHEFTYPGRDRSDL